MAGLPDKEDCARCVGGEMQLLGSDINIAGQNVIHDNILDKGATVMLLLIEGLGIIQRNVSHSAGGSCSVIGAGAEDRIFKVIGAVNDRLEGTLTEGGNAVAGTGDLPGCILPAFAQQRSIGTGNHVTIGINDAEGMLRNIF